MKNDPRSCERNLCNCVVEKNQDFKLADLPMPVEVLDFFQASLRNCINCVHNCEDHYVGCLWQTTLSM